MIRIGVFAKVGQVSVRTLRLYDEIGLLKPVFVDPSSGYRHYSTQQLPRLNRILALKDLGFSLEEIREKLGGNGPDAAALHAMLDRQQRRVDAEIARLKRVEAHLRQIELEGKMSEYDVVVKRLEPMLVASVRDSIPDWEQVTPTLNRLFDEVCDYVGQCGAAFAGAPFDLWLDAIEKSQDMAVAACVPLAAPIPASERVAVHELPGAETTAATLHRGSFVTIGDAHRAVLEWIEQNGYRVAAPGREIYLEYRRDGDPADWVTEIQYPMVAAA